jgi:hypothetical protein
MELLLVFEKRWTHHKKIDANEEMLARMEAHNERMMAKMDTQLEEMEACLGKTDATNLEANPE